MLKTASVKLIVFPAREKKQNKIETLSISKKTVQRDENVMGD